MDTWIAILISAGLSFVGVLIVVTTTWTLNREANARSRQTAMYDAVKYLLDASEDIDHVLQNLHGKALDTWSPDDKRQASNLCSRLNLVGALARNDVVDSELLCKLWYYSIPRVRSALDPFIREIRVERHSNYWSRFDWLVERCQQVNEDVQGYPLPANLSLHDPFPRKADEPVSVDL